MELMRGSNPADFQQMNDLHTIANNQETESEKQNALALSILLSLNSAAAYPRDYGNIEIPHCALDKQPEGN